MEMDGCCWLSYEKGEGYALFKGAAVCAGVEQKGLFSLCCSGLSAFGDPE